MNAPPPLTDRDALLAHRARADAGDGFFLWDAVAREVEERLIDVNRRFTAPAVVTAPGRFAGLLPQARRVADAPELGLERGAHDLVAHLMALHWADDMVGQLVQARLALRPDGLFLGAFWGGQTLAELRAALATAEAEIAGGLSPRVAPMTDIRDAGALLGRAGFALPVADRVTLRASYPDLAALARDLRAMGEQNALAGRLRVPTSRRIFARAETLMRDAGDDGRLKCSFDIVFLTGWAPSSDQPRPLRPGSATTRLADALGTVERTPGRNDPPR